MQADLQMRLKSQKSLPLMSDKTDSAEVEAEVFEARLMTRHLPW